LKPGFAHKACFRNAEPSPFLFSRSRSRGGGMPVLAKDVLEASILAFYRALDGGRGMQGMNPGKSGVDGMRAARDARVREGLDTDYELYKVINRKPGASIYELAKELGVVKRQGIRIC
jgi:hypothetical protein